MTSIRTVPPLAARCFASADFASLCVLEASAASRPPISHRAAFSGPVFRLCGLRFALCPRGFSRFAASDFAPVRGDRYFASADFAVSIGLQPYAASDFAPVPPLAARYFASADFASLCVLRGWPLHDLDSHRARLWRPGVSPLRTSARSVSSSWPFAASRFSHPVPPLAAPVFRLCGLRFALCPRGFSPSRPPISPCRLWRGVSPLRTSLRSVSSGFSRFAASDFAPCRL